MIRPTTSTVSPILRQVLRDEGQHFLDHYFTSRAERVWGGIGVGGCYNRNNDKYPVYDDERSGDTSLSSWVTAMRITERLGPAFRSDPFHLQLSLMRLC